MYSIVATPLNSTSTRDKSFYYHCVGYSDNQPVFDRIAIAIFFPTKLIARIQFAKIIKEIKKLASDPRFNYHRFKYSIEKHV